MADLSLFTEPTPEDLATTLAFLFLTCLIDLDKLLTLPAPVAEALTRAFLPLTFLIFLESCFTFLPP